MGYSPWGLTESDMTEQLTLLRRAYTSYGTGLGSSGEQGTGWRALGLQGAWSQEAPARPRGSPGGPVSPLSQDSRASASLWGM